MCPWSFISLTSLHQLLFLINYDTCCRYWLLYCINFCLAFTCLNGFTSYSWYYDIWGNEWQVDLKNLLPKIIKKTCKPNSRDLNCNWITKTLWWPEDGNIEIIINDKAVIYRNCIIIQELFRWLLSRYQIESETSMKAGFILDCVHLLYSICHKINFKRDGSNKDSPDWIRNNNKKQ